MAEIIWAMIDELFSAFRIRRSTLAYALSVPVLLLGNVTYASSNQPSVDLRKFQDSGEVFDLAARAPLGAFLLARHGKHFCAIQISKYWLKGDAVEPSTFHEGGQTKLARYAAIHRSDGIGVVSVHGSRRTEAVLTREPMVGIGRMAFARGNEYVNCGAMTLRWSYPTWIHFYPLPDIELAITQLRDPNRINFDDPKLKWYRSSDPVLTKSNVFPREQLCCK